MLRSALVGEQGLGDQHVAEVYDSAVAEHPEFLGLDQTELRAFIGSTLSRIAMFETVAHQPLEVTAEDAEKIAIVKIHSSTGSYDEPFKAEDNPRLREDKPWLAWFDKQRILHAVRLARKVAEVKSGYTVRLSGNYDENDVLRAKEEVKEQIAAYGPAVMYTGYPVETQKAEEVLRRPGGIIPEDKAIIIHGNPHNTVEGAQMMVDAFETYDYLLEGGQQIAVVTHAPHMARVLHIMDKYKYLPKGSDQPFVSPVATPAAGAHDFATMEARGLLYYAWLADSASKEPHPYQML